MDHKADKIELLATIKRVYENPRLHPPLTRTICPIHDGVTLDKVEDTYQCAECGSQHKYSLLSEEEYWIDYCLADKGERGSDAVGRLEFEQDAAALLWKLSAITQALRTHPLEIKHLNPALLCRRCYPHAREVGLDAVICCLLCEKEMPYSFTLDNLQELLTALWFKEEHLKESVLSTKLPIQFCIDYFFCSACRDEHFPHPFEEPDYRFIEDQESQD